MILLVCYVWLVVNLVGCSLVVLVNSVALFVSFCFAYILLLILLFRLICYLYVVYLRTCDLFGVGSVGVFVLFYCFKFG